MLYTVLKFTFREDSEYDYSVSLEVKGREIEIELFQERCHTTKKIRIPLRQDDSNNRLTKMIRSLACLQKSSRVVIETFDTKEAEQKKEYLTEEMWEVDDIVEEKIATWKREKKHEEECDRGEPDFEAEYFDGYILLLDKIRDILTCVLDYWSCEVNQQEKEMKFLSLIEKDPKCPVLFDDLTLQNAVLLPCQHLLCKKASDKLFSSYEANCPLCRQKATRGQLEVLY